MYVCITLFLLYFSRAGTSIPQRKPFYIFFFSLFLSVSASLREMLFLFVLPLFSRRAAVVAEKTYKYFLWSLLFSMPLRDLAFLSFIFLSPAEAQRRRESLFIFFSFFFSSASRRLRASCFSFCSPAGPLSSLRKPVNIFFFLCVSASPHDIFCSSRFLTFLTFLIM